MLTTTEVVVSYRIILDKGERFIVGFPPLRSNQVSAIDVRAEGFILLGESFFHGYSQIVAISKVLSSTDEVLHMPPAIAAEIRRCQAEFVESCV